MNNDFIYTLIMISILFNCNTIITANTTNSNTDSSVSTKLF